MNCSHFLPLGLALVVAGCAGAQRHATAPSVRVDTLGGALAGLEFDAASYLSRSLARRGAADPNCSWSLAVDSETGVGPPPPRVAGSAQSGTGWVGLGARLTETCPGDVRTVERAGQFAANSALGDVSERNAQWEALTSTLDLLVEDLAAAPDSLIEP